MTLTAPKSCALILLAAAVDEAASVPDALQGAMARGEVELTNEAARAKGRQPAAEFDSLLFDLGGSLMGLIARSVGMLLQAFQGLETPQG